MLTASSQVSVVKLFGSFMSPKTTVLLSLYRSAILRHKSPRALDGTLFCSYHGTMIGRIVMHIEDHPHALRYDIIDNSVEPPHLCAVEIVSQSMLNALPEDWDANDIHSLGRKVINRARVRIRVVVANLPGSFSAVNSPPAMLTPAYCTGASDAFAICTLQTARTTAN